MGKAFWILAFLGLAACGTIEGIGRDISSGARAVGNML